MDGQFALAARDLPQQLGFFRVARVRRILQPDMLRRAKEC